MTRIINTSVAEARRARASEGRGVLPPLRDRIRSGVEVLFVGINPGVRSALTGHHFAGFSNRFWKLMYESRLVPEPITFRDDDRLPDWGYGITNIVARATPGIDTLLPHEYVKGRLRLMAKIRKYRPRVAALVGVTVFRAMFPEHKGPVALGLHAQTLGGAAVFVLPNTSGRNANFSHAEMLAAFKGLRRVRRAPLHGAPPRKVSGRAAPRSSAPRRRQAAVDVPASRSRAR
jgi:TDG/mug DNA glycosylase family protein